MSTGAGIAAFGAVIDTLHKREPGAGAGTIGKPYRNIRKVRAGRRYLW
jgi:hypothetical protein